MILDSRIKEGKRPLTCIDIEQAREFVGKECIFSDFFINYVDIEKFNIDNDNEHTGILSIADDSSCDYIFINARNKSRYRFILPCEWVEPKEEKYRAYTLEEFIEAMESGLFESWIKMRHAKTKKECEFLYTGYQQTEVNDYICLACNFYDFKTLLRDYEIQDLNGKWHPFGVLEL